MNLSVKLERFPGVMIKHENLTARGVEWEDRAAKNAN